MYLILSFCIMKQKSFVWTFRVPLVTYIWTLCVPTLFFHLTTKSSSDRTTYSFLLYLEGFWYFSSPWPCIGYCKFLIDNLSIKQNHCSIPTTTLLVFIKSIRTNNITTFFFCTCTDGLCWYNAWLLLWS